MLHNRKSVQSRTRQRRLSPTLFAEMICAAFLISASPARAAGEHAVLAFDVPPVALEVRTAKPTCGDVVDVAKILANPSLNAALVGTDPKATLELESTTLLLRQLAKYGVETKGLVVHREGNVYAQCQTGCAVLPQGAQVREVLLSDRHAGNGASISGVGSGDRSNAMSLTSQTDLVSMDDYGYRDLRVSQSHRTVCVSAMNWSASERSTQIVKIMFDR